MENSKKSAIIKIVKIIDWLSMLLIAIVTFTVTYSLSNRWIKNLDQNLGPVLESGNTSESIVPYPIPLKWQKDGKIQQVYFESCLSGAKFFADFRHQSVNLQEISEICKRHKSRFTSDSYQKSLNQACAFGFGVGVSYVDESALHLEQTKELLKKACFGQ